MTFLLFKFSIFSLVIVIFLSLIPQSESAVASIDLGSEWMKVAVVNLKTGQSPISVAINEMSKRKSPGLVAFHGGNRLIGEEAAGIVARYPDKVFSQLRDMIGKPFGYVKELLDSLYLPFDVVEDSRGEVGFKVNGGGGGDVSVYSAEELVAMILSYGLSLAESHSKVPVKDAVISVPPYLGQAERKGLMVAAELAGINVLSLINEHSGAALQYGIDKDFSDQSRYVIFYDMGSSTTYATLVYFSSYNVKEFGKTVSVNQFQVKDVRWNSKLGGQDMELRLVEYFAKEFNDQVGNGVDVRKSPKAMAKLKKQVKRTKEILSANTMAPISVESLYDDRDFRGTITREKFEKLCEDLWEQSLVPVKDILKHSGLKLDEIFAVEMIGGATRVPKLQAKLQEFLGRKNLDRHLDADEAIVLGASLHAANLSDGIKLNRKLGMIDGSSYGFLIHLDGVYLVDDETNEDLVVPRMKKLPSKIFKSVKLNRDFEVSLSYENEKALPPGVSSSKFAQYAVSGLTDASDKYSSRNLSSPIKASLHYTLSRSGILTLDRAEALIEISEWIDVPKKNSTMPISTTASPTISDDGGSVNTTEEVTGKSGTDILNTSGEINSTSDTSLGEQSVADGSTEKKLKKRTFRVPLKVVEKTVGPGKSLSEESLSEVKTRLAALDEKDADRRRTAELKNNLEAYIYATKEKIESSDAIAAISTDQERKSLGEKLEEVQDWLYTDGEDASTLEFQERLDLLKAVGDPIFFRLDELSTRPEAVKQAHVYLGEIQQIVKGWEKNKPWLPNDRINEFLSGSDKLITWLKAKEEEQKRTSGFSTPTFTSEEVYHKVFDLQDKAARINRIPKPKPKPKPKVEKLQKNEGANESENADKDFANEKSQKELTAENLTDSSNEKEGVKGNNHDEL